MPERGSSVIRRYKEPLTLLWFNAHVPWMCVGMQLYRLDLPRILSDAARLCESQAIEDNDISFWETLSSVVLTVHVSTGWGGSTRVGQAYQWICANKEGGMRCYIPGIVRR